MVAIADEHIDALRARAQQEIDDGNIPACQFALALDGEVVVHETLGAAPANARFAMFSATKPIVASVVWQLIGDGLLDPSLPVASWWPGFAANGKQDVTLEQVMVHTSGFPNAEIDMAAFDDRPARVTQMEQWATEWEPGTRFEYHALSAHWVLAELIARVTGDDHRLAVRTRVLDPLGLDRLELGVPLDRQGDVQDLVTVGEPPTPAEVGRALGLDVDIELPPSTITLDMFDIPAVRAAGLPGGGGISDAASVARFYLALLDDRLGLWDPAVLHDATANVRNRLTGMLGFSAERTLGLETAGDGPAKRFRIGGGATSPATFGHGGAAGQIAWADPVTGLVFVFLTNGVDRNFLREARRGMDLCRLAAACVGARST
ncbi:MAG: serine hydrolase domain-containing protein [Ilumatobacteraceae bacterium]